MRQLTLFISSLLLVTSLWAQPKLAVLIVVDQLQAAYMTRFEKAFSGGFQRLQRQGAYFSKHFIQYVPTNTSPGHATIITGQPPRVHGIVGNYWWDRDTKKKVYSIPKTKDSSRMLSPTLGDQLKTSDEAARIVSISIKDRSAILMAGTKAELAVWFDRKNGQFISSSSYPTPPNWLTEFNAGIKTPRSKPIVEKFLASPESDQLMFNLIQTFFDQSDFGRDGQTSLLAVSFSGTDYVGHRFGPNSKEIKAQLLSLDRVLGDFFSLLDEKVGKENYFVALTSDHGVMLVPDSPEGNRKKARHIHKKNFEFAMETKIQSLFPVDDQDWLVSFQPPNLYLNRDLVQTLGLNWDQFLSRVALGLDEMSEVAYVFNPRRPGLSDSYTPLFVEGTHPERSGDLLIRVHKYTFVKPYFIVTGHGSPYDYDTHIPLFFMGPGIEKKVLDKKTRLIDLAPTLARLMGLELQEKLPGRDLSPLFLK